MRGMGAAEGAGSAKRPARGAHHEHRARSATGRPGTGAIERDEGATQPAVLSRCRLDAGDTRRLPFLYGVLPGRAPLRQGVKPSFGLRRDELPTAAALVLEKS